MMNTYVWNLKKNDFFMLPASVDGVTVWLETPEHVKSQTFNEKNSQLNRLYAFYISPHWKDN